MKLDGTRMQHFERNKSIAQNALNHQHCLMFFHSLYAVGFVILSFGISNVNASLDNPRIIEHPMDVMVPKHDPVTLNCKTEGHPTPSVQWFKDGEELKIDAGSHRILIPNGGLFFLKVIHSRRESDAGVYWCEAKSELGIARSRNATLQVAVLREEFRLEPQNMRVAQGETVLMECGPPRGSPEPTITWRKNGQILDLSNTKRIRLVDGGNLAIQDARQSDDGRYQCVAKNIAGIRESAVAFLKIHVKPFLIRGPQNQTAVVGSSVVFQCRVGGDPLPDVLWRRTASGGNMPLRRVHILEDRSLRLDGVTLEDMGEYSCEADNAVGSVTATGMLTVYSPPKFQIRPKTQIVELGSEVIFECQINGYPKPTIFWSFEGNSSLLFPGYKNDGIEVTITPEGRSLLSIQQIDRKESGKVVVCSAINAVGSVSSRVVVTIDAQDQLPPPIIAQGPVNQTLPVTSKASFPCRTIGLPTPQIIWYRDGIPIQSTNRINISDSGTLTIIDLNKNEDSGLYTCVANSRSGKSTWSGFLKIEVPTNPNIQFYRAPEISTYPSTPGKPQVVENTETSVTITWTRSNKVGASKLLGYVVEMFGRNDTDGWVTVGTRLQNTSFTQDGLNAGLNYFFIVRAENSHGLSFPSPLSEPIALGMKQFNTGLDLSEARASLLSGDVVELTNATSAESKSMKLTWQIINGKYVEGFYIYARQLEETSAKSLFSSASLSSSKTLPNNETDTSATYKMLTVLNGGGASTCTVTGLMKYTRYEFFIVPFYKSVEGKPSNSRIARTMEDVPSEPPTHIEALLLNSSAVFLKWKAPALKAHNGILLSYHVVVRGVDSKLNLSKILTNVTIEAVTPTLMLANLTEGVTYTVSIAAANSAGLGTYSIPATLRLDPITKRLDQFSSQRYPINHDHMDDVITQPWFIALLGSILAVMMLSFGAMLFVKRKHMLMKQSALSSIRGTHSNGVLKMPSLSRTANGFWLDPSGGGMIWRPPITTTATTTTTTSEISEMQKDQIADYAPVCVASTLPVDQQRTGQRLMGDYSNIPADYAEVSTFGKATSDYNTSGNRSPAPYATSSIVGSSRFGNYNNSSYPTNRSALVNVYQSSNDVYPIGNRSIYSESYFHPSEKIHITENKLNNMTNCHTFNPSMSMPNSSIGTIRRGRFKFSRPQNLHISFGDGLIDDDNNDMIPQQQHQIPQHQQAHHQHRLHQQPPLQSTISSDYGDGSYGGSISIGGCGSDTHSMNQQDEQLYIKVGETNPPDNNYMNWRENPSRCGSYNRSANSIGSNSMKVSGNSVNGGTGSVVGNVNGVIGICETNNRRCQDSESDVIYAPSGNRSLISYMSSNTQVDDV